jgi:nucleoside-diphosphate-sugar epimerase
MSIVVTGAGGFVGSHIVRALARHGLDVVAVYRGGSAQPPAAAHISQIATDLGDPQGLPNEIDAVVHAAAMLTGSASAMLRDNTVATARLVDYACAAGACRFIYLSSLSVYGDIAGPEVTPETSIINPGPYGLTKYLGEVVLRDAADRLPSLSIRLPGVIGRGARRNWLVTVCEQLRRNEEVTVFNPTAPFNNAAHVDDLCAFVAALLLREWRGAEAVTIGASGMTTVQEAVSTLAACCHSTSTIRVGRAPKASFTVSSRKACDGYGYAPMDILEMLRHFAAESTGAIERCRRSS